MRHFVLQQETYTEQTEVHVLGGLRGKVLKTSSFTRTKVKYNKETDTYHIRNYTLNSFQYFSLASVGIASPEEDSDTRLAPSSSFCHWQRRVEHVQIIMNMEKAFGPTAQKHVTNFMRTSTRPCIISSATFFHVYLYNPPGDNKDIILKALKWKTFKKNRKRAICPRKSKNKEIKTQNKNKPGKLLCKKR